MLSAWSVSYLRSGLWSGATLAVLGVLGLLTGQPTDVNIAGGGWTPGDIVRFGAHQPLTWGCAAAVLAVALARTTRR
jgi:hypothetical protein